MYKTTQKGKAKETCPCCDNCIRRADDALATELNRQGNMPPQQRSPLFLTVKGAACGDFTSTVSRALRQVQGIEEADVRLTLNLARIVLPRSTARALAEDAKARRKFIKQLVGALKESGYDAAEATGESVEEEESLPNRIAPGEEGGGDSGGVGLSGSSTGSNPPRSRVRDTRTGERPGHDDLPAELYVRIFSFVPCIDRLAAVALVCRRWSVLALDHRLHPPACLARGVSRADVCPQAAKSGHRHCLQRAHEGGFPWDEWTCAAAALNGHLECLAYAHANGCPWDGGTCASAALNGHLECLAYAHANGCPWRGLATY